jgi:hypothetical protein
MTAHYPALSQTYWVLGESRCQRPFTIKAAATGEGLTQVMQQCGCTMLAGSAVFVSKTDWICEP